MINFIDHERIPNRNITTGKTSQDMTNFHF